MPYELVEDAAGDPRNAAALAAACQFAYAPEPQAQEAFRNELGMEAKLISVDNTQVYVAGNDNHLVVAFRGSEGPNSLDGVKDWLLTNALNLLIQPTGKFGMEFAAAGAGARFHQGFVSAVSEIWDPLFAEVDAQLKAKDRPLWVTGHSLGGALAVLASWLFLRKTIPVHQVVTFGAPMVGNQDAVEAINREFAGKIFRYVNGPDPVPLLPMLSFVTNDYAHCDKVMLLGPADAAADLLNYLQSTAGEVAGGVFSGEITERVWAGLKGRMMAHLLNDYRKLIG